jgi:hypothetical protein
VRAAYKRTKEEATLTKKKMKKRMKRNYKKRRGWFKNKVRIELSVELKS